MRVVLVAGMLALACSDSSGGGTADAAVDAQGCDALVSCDDFNTCTSDQLMGAGTCAAACVHTPIPNCCGNGIVETGEACDDGNQADFDGCSHSCLYERALALNNVVFVPGTTGCDLDGNGTIDNAFGAAANDTARGRLSDYFSQSLGGCAIYVALFGLVGADPNMTGPFSFSFLSGVDTMCTGATNVCPSAMNYFSGHEPFYVRSEGLDSAGRPVQSITGMAPAGMLTTVRGPLTLVFPFCEQSVGNRVVVNLQKVSLAGTLTAGSGGPTGFDGQLCGAVPAGSLYKFPNYSSVGGMTVLDVMVVGVNSLGIRITPTQPDVDVDGDGLETMADTDGDANIDLCTDGNGTQITGRDCPTDPRIADAYSVALGITAVGAVLAGRQP